MKTENIDCKSVLADCGLSPAEIETYLACLRLGLSSAADISRFSAIKRGLTYKVLGLLVEKKMVTSTEDEGVKRFTATPPRNLLSIVEQQLQELERKRSKLSLAVSELEQYGQIVDELGSARTFVGVGGVMEIWEDMIQIGQDIYGLSDGKHMPGSPDSESPEAQWHLDYVRRRAAKGIWYYGIINKSPESDAMLRNRPAIKKLRKMITGLEIEAQVNIYGPKVAIISKQFGFRGILIESTELAETLRSFHKAVWKFLPDYVIEDDTHVAEQKKPVLMPL